jgi:hypothetical protein
MSSAAVPTLPTVGEIARQTGKPVHCVEYIVRTRGIKPIGRAGHAKIYAESDVAFIASELRRIDQEREEGHR